MEEYIKEINERIQNPTENINSIKGFEIISESLVYKVYDLFGRNSLLSILYQIGVFPGTQIAERLKREYGKEEFEIMEALVVLMEELKDFYSIQIRDIQQSEDKVKIIIENHCFLRTPISHREKLNYGKSFCRTNKGYFETAFKILLGNKIKKIEINFLNNDAERDACVEELIFYK
ncbi:MAG: hypothetical protein R3255_09210 [Candidatus Lokiarchaeia archaeon]|nr:hypothetical protein [Candidatus Lokiarchaeia archaeon]